jgi:SAM-dependent methyltransferase
LGRVTATTGAAGENAAANVEKTDASLSPFGAPAVAVRSFDVEQLARMYEEKCGLDIRRHFAGLREITLFECTATGMRYWRPSSVAGDARFYEDISRLWKPYYRTDRWEYEGARAAIPGPRARVVEVGCGRGYFLRSLEPLGHEAIGLELNDAAIAQKVTKFEVCNQSLEVLARSEPASFDAVCAFQVLEHLVEPRLFIESCLQLLRPHGRIIVSTPNHDYPVLARYRDPFDLPPHHVNQFTVEVYTGIATAMGLRLVSTRTQPARVPRLQLEIDGESPPFEQRVRRAANGILRAIGGKKPGLGRNVLAVLEKAS